LTSRAMQYENMPFKRP